MSKLIVWISFKWRARQNRRLLKTVASKLDAGHYLLNEDIELLDRQIGEGWWKMLLTHRKEILGKDV